MTPEITLFSLRLLSAFLLLAFLGLISWFLFQDIRSNRLGMVNQVARLGRLRVIANPSGEPAEGTMIELNPVSTVGRNARNSIVLDDGYISGEHALITWRDSKWWLEDLGSRNGTLLNGVPLHEPAVISSGDILTIGKIQLKLESGAGEGGESS